MKLHFPWLLLLMLPLMIDPAAAVILDDEPAPVAKPKLKPRQKTDAEFEVERLKKQLAEEKRKNSQSDRDESSTAESAVSRAPSIEMVTLPSGIKMGKTEVTQGQWRAVMGNNPSYFASCGDNCPVEQVSWDEAQQFIQRLNSQTGKRFRLPSEDEWFAACQAGRSSEYCGSDSIDAVAWYDSNSGDRTHPVGQKQSNAWGLCDMSGNVWEWTSSCYEGDCSQRVIRGGSWYFKPAYVRSAFRSLLTPSYRHRDMGFRLAQDP